MPCRRRNSAIRRDDPASGRQSRSEPEREAGSDRGMRSRCFSYSTFTLLLALRVSDLQSVGTLCCASRRRSFLPCSSKLVADPDLNGPRPDDRQRLGPWGRRRDLRAVVAERQHGVRIEDVEHIDRETQPLAGSEPDVLVDADLEVVDRRQRYAPRGSASIVTFP